MGRPSDLNEDYRLVERREMMINMKKMIGSVVNIKCTANGKTVWYGTVLFVSNFTDDSSCIMLSTWKERRRYNQQINPSLTRVEL